jgi:hypothetical protein
MEINMNAAPAQAMAKIYSFGMTALFGASLLVMGIQDASAGPRGGGGGGGRMAQSSVSGASRSMSGNSMGGGRGNAGGGNYGNGGRNNVGSGNGNNVGNGNRGNINVGNDVNIDIDGNNHGCCHGGGYYHPIAAGVAIGAVAVTTRAVMGSYYYALPPSGCTIVYRNGISYHYCGSVYYQQSYSGNSVVYVVVNP